MKTLSKRNLEILSDICAHAWDDRPLAQNYPRNTLVKLGLVEVAQTMSGTRLVPTVAGYRALTAHRQAAKEAAVAKLPGPRVTAIESRAVLAEAYKGRGRAFRMLIHAVTIGGSGYETSVLCGRVALESLADSFACDPDAEITCRTCFLRALKERA